MGTNKLSFSFKFINRKKIFNELQKLKGKKACRGSDIFSSYFPSNLKNADITRVFFFFFLKHRENVENYHPVSILPVLSKVYERCMYDQMYAFLNKIV